MPLNNPVITMDATTFISTAFEVMEKETAKISPDMRQVFEGVTSVFTQLLIREIFHAEAREILAQKIAQNITDIIYL